MRKLILTWAILRLVWESKGYVMKEMPGLLLAEFKRRGFSFASLQRFVKEGKQVPDDVAEFVLEKLAVREGEEENAEVVRLGLAALRKESTPNRQLPELALSMLARFPTDEQAAKLADALIQRAGLAPSLLDQLASSVEGFIRRAVSEVSSKIDAASSAVLEKVDALATVAASAVGKLNAMATAQAGTEAKLDTAHGKLDSAHDKLDALQASVANVEALVALVHATQVRQESDNRKASVRNRVLVFGGIVAVSVIITCHPPALSTAPLAQALAVPASQSVSINIGTGLHESIRQTEREGATRGDILWLPSADNGMGRGKKSRPMPHTRLRSNGLDQAVAPCGDPDAYAEFYRLCWKLTGHSPPCPSDEYEEGNKCYVPVYVPPKEPATETREPPNPEQR